MKVLHVLDKFSVDGSQIHGPARQLSYRVPCYDPARYEVQVVSLRGEEPAAELLRKNGITVRCLGRGKFDPRTLTDLYGLIRNWQPDVVHLSGYAAWNFGRPAAALAHRPVVVQEHFVDPRMPWYQRLADWLLRGWQRQAIAVSPSVRAFMIAERYIAPEQIRIIGNGVPSDRAARRSAEERTALRRRLQIPDGAKVVGIVGRLAQMKGHTYFLQAARRIADHAGQAVFVIVGEGPLRQALEREAQQLGLSAQVRFTGYQEDAAAHLSIFDVSVISSIYGEGFCSVGIESLAAGAAVVMTDIACVESCYEHERNILRVPVRDATAIAQAVTRLLADPGLAQRLVRNGQELVQACRIDAVAGQYLACYEEAVRKRLRACLFTGSFYPMVGGGETYARNIARRLKALGAEVFVLTRRIIATSSRAEMIDGVEVVRIGPPGKAPLAKYLMLPAAAWQLLRWWASYDVILVSNFRAIGPFAVVMAKVLGKRCVLRAGVCGEFSGEYLAANGAVSRRALGWLAAPLAWRTSVLRRADGFISNCAAISEEFNRHGVAKHRITLMPGGVDTDRFQPATPHARARLRQTLNLPVDRWLVGYSGKLNRGKGVNHLIAALPAILKRRPSAHVVLIGGGANQSLSQETELQEQVRATGLTGHVTFTGYVRNMPDYLRSLDLFVLPTEHEALPNALMEAMACGLPCVASRVGGIPDLIEHGISGLLIEPKSAGAIAEAVTAIGTDAALAGRLGAAARLAMEQRFSVDVLARRHAEYLSRFSNGNGTHS